MSDTHTSNNWMGTEIAFQPSSHPQYSSAEALSDTDKWRGVTFRVKGACSITHAATGLSTAAGTFGTYKYQLWPMSTTLGAPDLTGTVLAETATFSVAAGYTVHEQAFPSPYSATAGQMLAVLLIPVAVSGSNYCSWYHRGPDSKGYFAHPGNLISNDGGSSWLTSGDEYYPGIGLKTDKNFSLAGLPHKGSASMSQVNQAGDRMVSKFTFPADEDIEVHVNGLRCYGLWKLSSDESIKVGVWDAAGAEVGSSVREIEANTLGQDETDGNSLQEFYFSSVIKMVSGGSYYVGIEEVDAGFQAYGMDLGVDSGTVVDDYWPGGASWMKPYFWDASDGSPAWEEDGGGLSGTNYRLHYDLMITDIHGGGASVVATGKGKGDRGARAPLDCAKTEKERKSWNTSGSRQSLGKIITRSNGGYGWSPY